jgi:hypothetical protein
MWVSPASGSAVLRVQTTVAAALFSGTLIGPATGIS